VEKVIVSEENKKPAYDEQTLAKLLEAAYVLQEHSDELRALEAQLGLTRSQEDPSGKMPDFEARPDQNPALQESPAASKRELSTPSDFDSSATLAHIADLQYQIEVRQLKLPEVLTLIAGELVEMCDAAGAAIGILSSQELSYRAVIGIGVPPLSSSIPREKACGFPSLRTGQIFRCPDVNSELLIDAQQCTRRGIAGFIASPVFENNAIAGVVELYFSEPHSFIEQHVQTCQLMAGIVTGALSRKPKSLDPTAELSALVAQLSQPDSPEQHDSATSVRCYRCAHELMGGEQFCGQCGAARSQDAEPASMQSKLASLWHMKSPSVTEDNGKDDHVHDPAALAAEVPINVRALQPFVADTPEAAPQSQQDSEIVSQQPMENALELAGKSAPASGVDWSSAESASNYLQQVARGTQRTWLAAFWNQHRGDLYLTIAVLVVLVVLRFGLWSNRPVNAKSNPAAATSSAHKTAARELPIFDRVLIHLGLAEPPPVPEDKGNPSTTVWVDLQTGLYYCRNADSYGKTPRGKYASQRDAQLDQFAPAYRKVCD
jgi:hypothetical protein